jgi:hypothetical protein
LRQICVKIAWPVAVLMVTYILTPPLHPSLKYNLLKIAWPVAVLMVTYILAPPLHHSPKYNLLKEKNCSLNNLRHIGGLEFSLHVFVTRN